LRQTCAHSVRAQIRLSIVPVAQLSIDAAMLARSSHNPGCSGAPSLGRGWQPAGAIPATAKGDEAQNVVAVLCKSQSGRAARDCRHGDSCSEPIGQVGGQGEQ
jgi:hypothetical protein